MTSQQINLLVWRGCVLAFSIAAAVVCSMTWWETRGLSDAIQRNKDSTPVIGALPERIHRIEIDLAEIIGRLKERDLDANRDAPRGSK